MKQYNVNELRPHPHNNEFFDDTAGEAWTAFLSSVKTSGIIEPIVITPDKMIVSGHQRVRACKELEIPKIKAIIREYDNDDQMLKDLIETNIRQRGIGNTNSIKLGRCIKELERIYGIQHGATSFRGNQHQEVNPNNSDSPQITQSDLAEQLGISVDTLNNYKKLTEMIPELEDLVDTGIVTKTAAQAIVKKLSATEQEKLISELDVTEKITKKEIEKKIEEIKKKNEELDESEIAEENERLKTKVTLLEENKVASDQLLETYKKQVDEYQAIKNDMLNMSLDENSAVNFYRAGSEIATLNAKLLELLQNDLAPARYKPFIFTVQSENAMQKSFLQTLGLVKDWYDSMMAMIGEDQNYINDEYIDVEVL